MSRVVESDAEVASVLLLIVHRSPLLPLHETLPPLEYNVF